MSVLRSTGIILLAVFCVVLFLTCKELPENGDKPIVEICCPTCSDITMEEFLANRRAKLKLTETVPHNVSELDEEIKNRILQDYFDTFIRPYYFRATIADIWIDGYDGTYNGSVVVNIKRRSSPPRITFEEIAAIWDETIAGVRFRFHYRDRPIVWRDGVFYEIQEAFELGFLEQKDLIEITTFNSRGFCAETEKQLIHKLHSIGWCSSINVSYYLGNYNGFVATMPGYWDMAMSMYLDIENVRIDFERDFYLFRDGRVYIISVWSYIWNFTKNFDSILRNSHFFSRYEQGFCLKNFYIMANFVTLEDFIMINDIKNILEDENGN